MGILKSRFKRALKYIKSGVPEVTVKAEITNLLPNQLLIGRTALVTGGTSGIGKEIARAFLNAGANVIITGRNEERLEKAKAELQETAYSGFVKTIVLDNSDVASIPQKIKSIIGFLEGHTLDILVNNAGVGNGGSFRKGTEEEFDKIIDTNLKGTFFLSQIVAKYMKENKVKGNILNISSSSGIRPAISAYMVSKWAIRGFTQGLAKLLIPYDIVVNGIAPGPTATPMLLNNNENLALFTSPSKRYATPEEIANMAVILVSNMSRMIVGDIVYMTGGAGTLTFDDIFYKF